MRKFVKTAMGNRLLFAEDPEFVPINDPGSIVDFLAIERNILGEAFPKVDPVPFAVEHGSLLFPPSVPYPSGLASIYGGSMMDPGARGHSEDISFWLSNERTISDILRLASLALEPDPASNFTFVSMAVDQVAVFEDPEHGLLAAFLARGDWDGRFAARMELMESVPTNVYLFAELSGACISSIGPIDEDSVPSRVEWLKGRAQAAASAIAVRYMDLNAAPAGTLLRYLQDITLDILRGDRDVLSFCRICGAPTSPSERRHTYDTQACKSRLYPMRDKTLKRLAGLGVEDELAKKLVCPLG